MNITFQYGAANSLTRDLPCGATLRNAHGDSSIRAGLRAGDNIEYHIGGCVQSLDTPLADGMVVQLHDKECKKAN